MEIGMKKNFAAIALCIAASLCAFADWKSDMLPEEAKNNNAAEVARLIKSGADIRSEQSKMAEDIC